MNLGSTDTDHGFLQVCVVGHCPDVSTDNEVTCADRHQDLSVVARPADPFHAEFVQRQRKPGVPVATQLVPEAGNAPADVLVRGGLQEERRLLVGQPAEAVHPGAQRQVRLGEQQGQDAVPLQVGLRPAEGAGRLDADRDAAGAGARCQRADGYSRGEGDMQSA